MEDDCDIILEEEGKQLDEHGLDDDGVESRVQHRVDLFHMKIVSANQSRRERERETKRLTPQSLTYFSNRLSMSEVRRGVSAHAVSKTNLRRQDTRTAQKQNQPPDFFILSIVDIITLLAASKTRGWRVEEFSKACFFFSTRTRQSWLLEPPPPSVHTHLLRDERQQGGQRDGIQRSVKRVPSGDAEPEVLAGLVGEREKHMRRQIANERGVFR